MHHENDISLIQQAQDGNQKASHILFVRYEGYINRVAFKYANTSIEHTDVVGAARVGFIRAIQKYNTQSDTRGTLGAFSIHYMREEILSQARMMQLPMHVARTKQSAKVFNNVTRYRNEQGMVTEQAMQKMAEELNVDIRYVRETCQCLNISYVKAHETDDDSDDSNWGTCQVACNAPTTEQSVESMQSYQNVMTRANELYNDGNEMRKDIMLNRVITEEPTQLASLANRHGVSAERIRQIQKSLATDLKEAAFQH